MWEKIKNIFTIIVSALAVIVLTVVCFFACRSKADRRGSTGASERDSAIKDGITNSEERAERIESGISRAEDGVGKCEEHLQRAEDILRRAIERNRTKKSDTKDVSDCNNDS